MYKDKCISINDYFVPPQDESHFLKNMKTARCRAALPLLKVRQRLSHTSTTRSTHF